MLEISTKQNTEQFTVAVTLQAYIPRCPVRMSAETSFQVELCPGFPAPFHANAGSYVDQVPTVVFILPGMTFVVPVGVVPMPRPAPYNRTARAVRPVPVVIGNTRQDDGKHLLSFVRLLRRSLRAKEEHLLRRPRPSVCL